MVATVKNNCIIIHKLNLQSTFALALPVTAEYNGNTYPDDCKYKGLFQYLFVVEQHHPFPWDIWIHVCTCGTLHFVYTLVTLVKSNYPGNK